MLRVLCSSSSDDESAPGGPHRKAGEVLTLNLAPREAFGVAWRSPAVLVTLATPGLSGDRGATSTCSWAADALGSAAAAQGTVGAEARAAPAALPGSIRPAAEAEEPEQREETDLSGGAARTRFEFAASQDATLGPRTLDFVPFECVGGSTPGSATFESLFS